MLERNERFEQILTLEEVLAEFEHVIGPEKIYLITKTLHDDKGLYELEIGIAGESEGERSEYQYRREFGAFKNPEIHVAYYEDGDAVGGTSVARYIDGEWKIL